MEISCSGWTRSRPNKIKSGFNFKQGGLRKGGSECCTRKRKRRSARKSKNRSAKGFRKWSVRRRRNGKRIGRQRERGHAVQRKQGPKQFGRENILGALSKSQDL